MSEARNNRIKDIFQKIRVTKVVATRSVKGRNGDTFAGFSAAWDSVQNDYGGPGADVMPDAQEDAETSAQGMTFREGVVAMHMVQMQTSIAALDAAYANGTISGDLYEDQKKSVKNRFGGLIAQAADRLESDD